MLRHCRGSAAISAAQGRLSGRCADPDGAAHVWLTIGSDGPARRVAMIIKCTQANPAVLHPGIREFPDTGFGEIPDFVSSSLSDPRQLCR